MRIIFALLLVTAAACGEGERSGSADAARADSSAAGYTVGRRADSALHDTALVDSAAKVAATGSRPPNDSAVRPVATAGNADTTTKSRTVSRTVATTTRPAVAGKTPAAAKDSATRRDSTRTRPPNVTASAPASDSTAHAAAPTGPVRVNEFLTYDPRSRIVSLQLIAGYNGLNGSLNYNGATSGSHGLIVPKGWRIHVAVTNRDSDLQHSAIVIAKVLPPPIEPADPAFDGAALARLDEGLQEDETGTLDFVATRPGHFMIACGVPGHAQAGEWLELVVTNSALPPSYR